MYGKLGLGWGNTLLALLAMVFGLAPLWFYRNKEHQSESKRNPVWFGYTLFCIYFTFLVILSISYIPGVPYKTSFDCLLTSWTLFSSYLLALFFLACLSHLFQVWFRKLFQRRINPCDNLHNRESAHWRLVVARSFFLKQDRRNNQAQRFYSTEI
jgi:hypothetical protein